MSNIKAFIILNIKKYIKRKEVSIYWTLVLVIHLSNKDNICLKK